MAATEEPEASFEPASKPAAAALGHVLEVGAVEAAGVEGLGAVEAFRWGSGHSAC